MVVAVAASSVVDIVAAGAVVVICYVIAVSYLPF